MSRRNSALLAELGEEKGNPPAGELLGGYVRSDAIAGVPVADRAIVLFIERDLGTERGDVLPGKIRRYRSLFGGPSPIALSVGFVVEVRAPGAVHPEPGAPISDRAANADHHRRTAGCRPDRRALGRGDCIHPHAGSRPSGTPTPLSLLPAAWPTPTR